MENHQCGPQTCACGMPSASTWFSILFMHVRLHAGHIAGQGRGYLPLKDIAIILFLLKLPLKSYRVRHALSP